MPISSSSGNPIASTSKYADSVPTDMLLCADGSYRQFPADSPRPGTILPISAGGTSATSATDARTSLGVLSTADASVTYVPQTAMAPIGRLPKWPAASSIITQAQSGHGWLGSSGFVANDTVDFVLGTQSMKIPTNGAGGTFKMEKTGLSVDTTGQQIRLRMKIENLAHLFTTQFLAGNDTGYAACFTWILAAATVGSEVITEGDWVTYTLPFSSATVTGSPTRSGIVAMKMTVRDDNTGAVVTGHLQSVEMVAEPTATFASGLVSICFDDTWDTQWTLAKPILDAAGLRASFYTIQDLIGATSRLTLAQLLTMQDQGHEITAHAATTTAHNATWTGETAAALGADISAQLVALRQLGLRGAGTAYPSGNYGLTSDGQSTMPYARRFSYARTVCRRTHETWPPAEPFRLRAQSTISTFAGGYDPSLIYTDTTGDIDKAKAAHAWLILSFHKLTASAPAASNECTTASFQAIVNKIVSAGMTCLPIGDALAYYG